MGAGPGAGAADAACDWSFILPKTLQRFLVVNCKRGGAVRLRLPERHLSAARLRGDRAHRRLIYPSRCRGRAVWGPNPFFFSLGGAAHAPIAGRAARPNWRAPAKRGGA